MTDEINVLSRTQEIHVEPTSGSVSIINAGPPGPGSGSGGDALWESVDDDLHPIDNPVTFTIDAGQIAIQGDSDVTISSSSGLVGLNQTGTGSIYLDPYQGVVIQLTESSNFIVGRSEPYYGAGWIYLECRHGIIMRTPSDEPDVLYQDPGSTVCWVDESTDEYVIRSKYETGGTVKEARIPLT